MIMCLGLSDNLQQVDESRKTVIINCELKMLNIDIDALQEIGKLKEHN